MAGKKNTYFWIFFAIILLSLGVRALTLFLLPEPAFGDGTFHLKIVKEIVSTGNLPQEVDAAFSPPEKIIPMPLPAFHVLSALLYSFSSTPMQEPFTKLIPFFISAAFLLTAFLLSKEIFKENWVVSIAFTAANYFLVVFGSLNYVDLLAGLAVLASFYFITKFFNSRRHVFLFPLFFLFPLLALSKLNAAPLLLILVPTALYAVSNANPKLKRIFLLSIPVFAILVALFVFFFGLQYVQNPLETAHSPTELAKIFFLDYLEFLAFPPAQALSGMLPAFLSAQSAAIIFFLVSLPLLFVFLFGFKKLYSSDKFLFWSILFLVLANHYLTIKSILNKDVSGVLTTARHFIPTIALYSIPFAFGFIELKKNWLRAIAFASFALIMFSMIFYAGFVSLHYYDVKQQHSGFYEFVSSLPPEARVAGTAQHIYLKFYLNRSPVYLDALYSPSSTAAELETELKQSADYLALSCYKETARIDLVQGLLQKGSLKEAYADECVTVYKKA